MNMKKIRVLSFIGLLILVISYLAFCFTTISYKNELYSGVAISLFVVVSLLYIMSNYIVNRLFESKGLIIQLHNINIFGIVGLVLVLLQDWQSEHFPGYQRIILIIFLLMFLVSESIHMRSVGLKDYYIYMRSSFVRLKENIGLLSILFVFLMLSYYTGGTPYKWDSRLYFLSCQNLNVFSISSLAIYGHIAQTFGLIMKIGIVIFGDVKIAAYMMNVLLAMLSIISFYGIVRYIRHRVNKAECILATCVYAFSSYILGLVNYLSLDYYCACLFPVLLYVTLKGRWIYHILVAFLFCFTKEPAVIIYAGICLAYFIYTEVSRWRKERNIRLIDIIVTPQYWYMLLVACLWLCTYKILGPWSAGNGGIAIDFDYMVEKLQVMFMMNFSWYFTVLSMISVVTIIYLKKKRELIFLLYLIIPMSLFTIFSCLFKTINHYRYNSITLGVLCILSIICILDMKNLLLRKIILFSSCFICLISSYWTIDPVSKQLFQTISTGNGYVISTSDEYAIGDSTIYNKQMLWTENVLNNIFKDAIEEQDLIVLQAQNFNMGFADGMIGMVPLEDGENQYTILWDEMLDQRVNVQEQCEKKIDMYQVGDIQDIENLVGIAGTDNIFSYISISDDKNGVFDDIKERYVVVDEKEYSYGNWKYVRLRFKE